MMTSLPIATENDPLITSSPQPSYHKNNNDGENGLHSHDTELPPPSSTKKTALILASVWIGALLAAIDSTIVATLLVPISTSFASFKNVSWVGSAFLITQSVSQPLSGRLTDIYGRRAGLLFSNFCFGVGTLICGLARSEWVLIFGRAVAGVGGGSLLTLSMVVAGDLTPLRNRGFVHGCLNILLSVGTGSGGLLGGWVNAIWGWRVAFLLQVPLIVFGSLMVAVWVKIPIQEHEKSSFKRVDYFGSLTLTISVVLLLVGTNSGGNVVPWSHPLILISLPLAGMWFMVFILVEGRIAAEPIIPPRLLTDRTVAAACFTFWFFSMSYYGVLYFVPIYLQLMGKTPAQAGLRFISLSAGSAFFPFAVGLVMRFTGKYSTLNKLSNMILVLSCGLIACLNLASPSWPPFVFLALFGAGAGGMAVTTMTAMVSAVKQDEQAVVTSANFAFRSTGSAIGLTVSSVVFQNLLRIYLRREISGLGDADEIIERVRADFSAIENLDETLQDAVRECCMSALSGVFWLICGMNFLAALSSVFMRQHKLHKSIDRR